MRRICSLISSSLESTVRGSKSSSVGPRGGVSNHFRQCSSAHWFPIRHGASDGPHEREYRDPVELFKKNTKEERKKKGKKPSGLIYGLSLALADPKGSDAVPRDIDGKQQHGRSSDVRATYWDAWDTWWHIYREDIIYMILPGLEFPVSVRSC